LKRTKRIIQPNDYSCLAACAAMAAGQDIQDVFKFCGHDGNGRGFSEIEICRYLIENNIVPGLYKIDNNGEKLENIYDICVYVNNRPAIITVKSRRFKNVNHCIYWDGKKVYDPSPTSKSQEFIKNYKVMFITFLSVIQDYPNKFIKLIPI